MVPSQSRLDTGLWSLFFEARFSKIQASGVLYVPYIHFEFFGG